ncbi:MAG: twin-arginine translocase TatA/TatE family subunit [Syntrophomonadaceae bacterium]|nr:twin-arginine translocase TatA/TatE family subunit [Syntrophomonadaceae bacterium]
MSVFGFLPSVGPWELILILAIALIIFGPGKLPEVGRSLGKTINEFRRASVDIKKQIEEEVREVKQVTEDTTISNNATKEKV